MKISNLLRFINHGHLKVIGLFLALCVLVLPATLPLFRSDFFRMHDFTHVARLIELHRGLVDGQIPARWSDNFGYGYGMPLLHFYGPLPYYIAELFHIVGFDPVTSIKAIFWLNFIAGFLFMYWLAKEFFGRWGGILAATAFIYAPYRAVQFYVRGALSEMTATTFLPLALWGLYNVCKSAVTADTERSWQKSWQWVVITACSIAGVFLSHNVVALFSIPVLIGWTLVWLWWFSHKQNISIFRIPKTYGWLCLSGLLAFGLSAWFIVPAFLEKDFTIVNTIGGGYSYYKLHFVYLRQFIDPKFGYGGSVLGPEDGMSFQFGLWHIALLGMVAGLSLVMFSRITAPLKKLLHVPNFSGESNTVIISSAIGLGLTIFMMTFHSTPVWEALPIIHIAQFPWRFLSFSIVFIALCIGSLGLVLNAIKNVWVKTVIGGLIILCGIGINMRYFKPLAYTGINDYFYTDVSRIKTDMSGILRDYLPVTVSQVPLPGLDPIRVVNGDAQITDFVAKTGQRQFSAEVKSAATVELATFYFPGWFGRIDNKPVSLVYSQPYGFITIPIQPGSHHIEIRLGKTWIQTVSDTFSAATLIVGLISLIMVLSTNRKLHRKSLTL